jgi:hypothetical protein
MAGGLRHAGTENSSGQNNFRSGVAEINDKMNVTPAKAGVQIKAAWIPAYAGMTDRCHAYDLKNMLDNISGKPH